MHAHGVHAICSSDPKEACVLILGATAIEKNTIVVCIRECMHTHSVYNNGHRLNTINTRAAPIPNFTDTSSTKYWY